MINVSKILAIIKLHKFLFDIVKFVNLHSNDDLATWIRIDFFLKYYEYHRFLSSLCIILRSVE